MTIEEMASFENKMLELEEEAEKIKRPSIITDWVRCNGLHLQMGIESLPNEYWIDAVGLQGIVKCSNLGRFVSLDRPSRINKSGNAILKQREKNHYFQINPCFNGKSTHLSCHRLLALSFIENPLNLPQVNHLKGCKLDNRIIRLEWSSCSDNMKHAYKMGGARQDGEFHATKKLNWEKVHEIRARYSKGASAEVLGKEFGVHPTHISAIAAKKYWKDKN